jgi:hypothetical protein
VSVGPLAIVSPRLHRSAASVSTSVSRLQPSAILLRVLRERLSAETRLKTGWLIPSVAGLALQIHASVPEMPLGYGDQVLLAALTFGGVLVGVLWQWYSPRPIGNRLVAPAFVILLSPILFLLPTGEWSDGSSTELHFRPGFLMFGAGIVAGVVLMDLWQRYRSAGEPEQ